MILSTAACFLLGLFSLSQSGTGALFSGSVLGGSALDLGLDFV